MADSQTSQVPFGHAMREAHFNFAPSYTPLNHGAFGTYPTTVLKRLRRCQELAEARPDTFIRWDIPRELDSSRAALASFLDVPASEIVLIQNATTGVNTVLRSLRYEKEDVIIYFSTLYGACEKTVSYVCETTDAEAVGIDLHYPCKDEQVVEKFRLAIRNVNEQPGKKVRIAIFDTVTSLPGVRVPWEDLCSICREQGILSMVDGAHGIGHIRLDLKGADPDFFVSNCHKWVCSLLLLWYLGELILRKVAVRTTGLRSILRTREEPTSHQNFIADIPRVCSPSGKGANIQPLATRC